jgi:hypothetical protein
LIFHLRRVFLPVLKVISHYLIEDCVNFSHLMLTNQV